MTWPSHSVASCLPDMPPKQGTAKGLYTPPSSEDTHSITCWGVQRSTAENVARCAVSAELVPAMSCKHTSRQLAVCKPAERSGEMCARKQTRRDSGLPPSAEEAAGLATRAGLSNRVRVERRYGTCGGGAPGLRSGMARMRTHSLRQLSE
eukprot:scaffold220478_cov23-Tisochrysis_lutea.AAC.1